MRPMIALVLLALPALAAAQPATISPGMSRAQVVSALGQPVNAREASEYTYLFYANECGIRCGMNDLVVLRRDSVVDAIFRSPSRRYTGTSSSPTPTSPEAAQRAAAAPSQPMTMPARDAAKPATPVPVAKAPAAAAPAAPAAATRRPATEADLSRLRQQLIGTGLTNSQIRARLRAEGYPADLLDADIRAATGASPMMPGPANDTRPSIPVAEPLRPAPAPAAPSKPATASTTTTPPPAP